MFIAMAFGASGCVVGDEDEPIDEAAELEDTSADSEAETLTIEATFTTSARRVSNGHGTAYVWVNRTTAGTRTAGIVDECSGGTSWRIKRVSSGYVLASGFRQNCVGGGIGTAYSSAITVQIFRSGAWVNAVTY